MAVEVKIFIITLAVISILHSVTCNYVSEDKLKEQLMKYVTKTQSPDDVAQFKQIIEIFKPPTYITYQYEFTEYTPARQTLTCVVCRVVIDTVKKLYLEDKYSEGQLVKIVQDLCVLMEIQTENVCNGAVAGHMPIILYVMANQPNFKAESFCGITYQSGNPLSCPFQDDNYEFQMALPQKNNTIQKLQTNGETFRIIHVSDLHYDPIYEPFGLAECNEPTCCRKGQSNVTSQTKIQTYDDTSMKHYINLDSKGKFHINLNYADKIPTLRSCAKKDKPDVYLQSKRAGYWGDYRRCDAPWWAVEDAIDHIVDNHNLKEYDIIYHTGDIIDHGVWEVTKQLVRESVAKTADKMKSAFGNRLVINALGNHDTDPVNQFAPSLVTEPRFSSQWMYDIIVEEWRHWLPQEAHETIKQGGFYSLLVKPGFRVVVINNNFCSRDNWWIHMQPRDINGQLAWLIKTLYSAEQQGESVHILAHTPPGRADCNWVYTREYKRIMERFADTVISEFNGHTHKDEFKVYYEKKNIDKAFLVAWTAGSINAYSSVNPNYKIITVDSNTLELIDSDVWLYNLTEANLTPEQRPSWYKEYSFRETYKVPDMSASSIDALLNRMVTTEQHLLTKEYHTNRWKHSDPHMNNKCDNNCAKGYLSSIATSELYDTAKAEYLWNIFQTNTK